MPTSSQALILIKTVNGKLSQYYKSRLTSGTLHLPISTLTLSAEESTNQGDCQSPEPFPVNGGRGILSFDPETKSLRWRLFPADSTTNIELDESEAVEEIIVVTDGEHAVVADAGNIASILNEGIDLKGHHIGGGESKVQHSTDSGTPEASQNENSTESSISDTLRRLLHLGFKSTSFKGNLLAQDHGVSLDLENKLFILELGSNQQACPRAASDTDSKATRKVIHPLPQYGNVQITKPSSLGRTQMGQLSSKLQRPKQIIQRLKKYSNDEVVHGTSSKTTSLEEDTIKDRAKSHHKESMIQRQWLDSLSQSTSLWEPSTCVSTTWESNVRDISKSSLGFNEEEHTKRNECTLPVLKSRTWERAASAVPSVTFHAPLLPPIALYPSRPPLIKDARSEHKLPKTITHEADSLVSQSEHTKIAKPSKRKKPKVPNVRMRRHIPKISPLTLCFCLKNMRMYSHVEVKDIIESQIFTRIKSLQFDPVYLHLGIDNTDGICLWVFTLESEDMCKHLLQEGLDFLSDHVRIRRYADVLRVEHQTYCLYRSVLDEQENSNLGSSHLKKSIKGNKKITFTSVL